MPDAILTRLRTLDEDDIEAALLERSIALPIGDHATAVELVNTMLDYVTEEQARIQADDEARMPKAVDARISDCRLIGLRFLDDVNDNGHEAFRAVGPANIFTD